MNVAALQSLLEQVQQGDRSVDEALEQLRHLPFEDIGDATIDHHRALRQGFAEVIFGANKTVDQITRIIGALLSKGSNVLATRLDDDKAQLLLHSYPTATWHKEARCLTIEQQPVKITGRGTILVISAGTADIPVAAEAVVTARIMGNQVEQLFDVGVAGLHRLLARRERILSAAVLIVVAGMEGALPSVVGGMVSRPVIAVPTSVGYGASFGGIAALLGMLNSCASGVTVVNIDNGFGAGYAASLMNRE
jgi:pyridinium-3,5-biscarboxylic acid mononucleotide synthase